MRPSRFRPALTASLRRQKLNGFFIAIVSPVWRGRTVHGCRSTAAPLQTSRPRSTRPGNLAPTRDRMRAFGRPDITSFPGTWVFVTQFALSSTLPPAWNSFPGPKKLRSLEFRKSADNGCKGNAANCLQASDCLQPRSAAFLLGDNAFAVDPLRTLVRLCRIVHCR